MDQQLGPVMRKLSEFLLFLEDWLHTNVLTWQMAAQWLSVLVALLLTLGVWRLIRPRMTRWVETYVQSLLVKGLLSGIIHVGGFVLFIMLAQTGAVAFEFADINPWVLDAVSQLTAAGIGIRLLVLAMPNKMLARGTATVIWVFVGLNVLGLFAPFALFLEKMSFTMGETQFTALGALKGMVLAIVFLQAAVILSRFATNRIDAMGDVSPSVQALLSKTIKVVLFTVAILLAMSSVGIDLTSLAIFSSALGVGIGFGLQTIISNYVAGVILLMDRSIKPGDTIEVAGVFGVVRNVFGRYVSVLTRDGKEYLIPNEQFVTSEVINWTYSDTNIRLKIPVGISYGSDVDKAMHLMEESVRGLRRILTSPKPQAMLIEFGDSSVNLELRAWIADANQGVTNIKSEVLIRIWNLFHEHGIEFPFPQRDVLIKPGSALSLTMDKGENDD
ncbi:MULTISPECIES: mechanosensitive ion channel domain-containing protein [unclassified Pseudodesulfovibrio]|uniref:mechanosensitive ion channel family protein n=1 Tax=unclassified Pseudodesulfovibrio TaxID=2661612 RepID=UPI000FEC0904|nr:MULTISPECIES: mechanosensitive ion channel domain-containing protein [unclassified Pseudodesulfovibrio]MCJ2166193.1 mechanosensitive ion channel [Pseudodesulfovibrio sp. S3-i]RWU02341.1 mechanosensitive ion channel protein MscS [Pseudodesulfovibrio sp. S3]